MWYGPTCPQVPRTGWLNDENAFLFQWDDGQPGEDCLRINVFTPAIRDGQKRPVMLWLHGGGFTNGNGIEHDGYNGENFARFLGFGTARMFAGELLHGTDAQGVLLGRE